MSHSLMKSAFDLGHKLPRNFTSSKYRFHCRADSLSAAMETTKVMLGTLPGNKKMKTNPPIPPFAEATAVQKVRMAEDAWNGRDPESVAMAYTVDSVWRNRVAFIRGREEIVAFLTQKWTRELDYRLIKELWAFQDNRIAVRFAYEWHDADGHWYRSYGNENWEFNSQGLMRTRIASINDLSIKESERKFHWSPGRRPDDYAGLSELGL